jgi:hypothetical protein
MKRQVTLLLTPPPPLLVALVARLRDPIHNLLLSLQRMRSVTTNGRVGM